jgi:phosphatidylglycerophosphate synthase
VFDAALRRRVDPVLDRIARLAVRAGVRADAITLGGAAIGLAACVAIALRADMMALALLALNRVADGLDGAVARQTGPTDRGGFLDIVCDFLFYGGFVFAFAVGRPETALAAAFLLVSFIGTASSFLAFAVFAAKRGLTTDVRGAKSLYYLGGLTEGAETIALFALVCIVPAAFPLLAWGFGALCWITVAVRVAAGWSAFRQ